MIVRSRVLKSCLWAVVPAILVGISFSKCDNIFAAPQDVVTQPPVDTPSAKIEIADEPKSIDPATLMNPRLAAPTTIEFDGVSMKELYRWLQEEQKLSVSVDAAAMKEKGILSSELVTDKLNNEPLYLILDHLKSLGIGWYEEDGDLFLTTTDATRHTMTTVSYNLGELLDAGFEAERVLECISSATGSTLIENGDEDGSVVLLGDVVFVRQTQHVQQEVRGLLAGLEMPARRTLTLDPPQHAALREKLIQKFSLTLEEVPLSEAIEEIARVSDADIRLNAAELKRAGARDRSPVSIDMVDQKLSLVLQSALSQLKLTWLLQDGVIWVVEKSTAESAVRTAIYDVRDLCRDEEESEAMKYALMEQTGGSWREDGEYGVLMFARPGILIVRHTEQTLDSVLQLLENYRTALRQSKPRKQAGPDPKEVITYYYRLPTDMAQDLQVRLSELVRPETWKSENKPDAPGTIMILRSTSDLRDAYGRTPVSSKGTAPAPAPGHLLVVDNSVLIIRHMREVHEEIDMLLNKLTTGERPMNLRGGFGGGGQGGQGGFGGGFFDVR